MTKSKKKTTNDAVTPAVHRAARSSPRASGTNADIACRAYDLFLTRGAEHGHDVDDWVQAERELQYVASKP